ncbi:DsbA family protein [Pinisolibacter aquiterrae]|uniref:DsbA family protein n=1 Tax=Pinisolibacter aquiterrae TaxID=2815579 RepID=UPI001C3E7161|nr:DsbA family protein [Pinisolibacter aquiterrae]MBV5265916.1 DsbA family protein [Pinisolibacter aquiterrae]MCC8237226.1 DsbA family protein [Pinisolibacter aquiterrae]
MSERHTLELLAFTDPVCTWCWGSEPVLRKLQVWYGDQIRIVPVMGGLVEDIRAFYDRANAIGGDPEQANAQIARHWREASARHGMPVETEGFRLFSAETVSTYPQNIAYKAVELVSPELAPRFLRRMREASAAEARETGKRSVLIELANEVGVDVATFIERLNDGSAEQAFLSDRELIGRYRARGFPTFLLRWNKGELLLRGYQTFRQFQAVISTLTELSLVGTAPGKTTDALFEFLKTYDRAAEVELMEVFDLTRTELAELLTAPGLKNRIRFIPAGNGGFWEVRAETAVCDSNVGQCSV